MRLIRPRLAAVAILTGLLAVNGAATLYAAATPPTIKACIKSSGPQKGLMRYLATGSCATGETALAWNVTGPQGPAGPAAPSGGGAAVYYRTELVTPPFKGGTRDMKLDLPAGQYLLSFNVRSTFGDPTALVAGEWSVMACKLGETKYTMWIALGDSVPVSDNVFVKSDTPKTYTLSCEWAPPRYSLTSTGWSATGVMYATPADVHDQ